MAYERHPDDLPLYLGMLQARESMRQPEIDRHRKLLRAGKADWAANFRLAAALWITWGASEDRFRNEQTRLKEAALAAKRSWEDSRNVTAGMLYGEILDRLAQRDADLLAADLLRRVSGPDAWRRYQRAKAVQWRAEPPPLHTVPASQRRALTALVGMFWSKAGARYGPAVVKNGFLIPRWQPIPPLRKAEHAYMEKWLRMLIPGWEPPKRGK